MTTLTDFLLERLAEDEARAATTSYYWNEVDALDRPSTHHVDLEARVLAQVEALRAVVALHQDYGAFGDCFHQYAGSDGDCPTLLALAQPYRDHPDFDPSWLT